MKNINYRILLLGAFVFVLIALNFLQYFVEGEPVNNAAAFSLDSEKLYIPPVLEHKESYQYTRDIFNSVEIELTSAVEPIVEEIIEPIEKTVKETGSPIKKKSLDIKIKAIANRKGKPIAMVMYKGQQVFLEEGDVLDGHYVVESITKSQIHVSDRSDKLAYE